MRRRTSGSLADRMGGTAQQPPAPTVKHCWVIESSGRLPGLLLGWRRGAAGWEGRVVHPVHEPSGWALVEEWLPAEALEGT